MLVRQKRRDDCGVACLAMLCGVSYEKAKDAISWYKTKKGYGTTTSQLRKGAIRLGYTARSTPQNRLKRVRVPDEWLRDKGFGPPHNFDFWYLIPDNSLVKVPIYQDRNYGDWHWVVWKDRQVYDSAHGVFHPGKYGLKPVSYMQFVKEESDDET